jgi:hypothetical protein
MSQEWLPRVVSFHAKYEEKVNELMRKILEDFVIDENIDPPSKVGSKQLSKNSVRDYEKHFRMLNSFLGMIGDVESMLMFLPHPPTLCPSINTENIFQFKWKRGKKCETLKDSKGGIVKDILGEVIYCDESWSCGTNAQQFFGSITCIHNAFGHFGDYIEKCTACINLKEQDGNETGCIPHKYSPKFWRSGNPVKSV